ncbi:MAG TPA: hypothetical protein DCZ55_21025 [Cyanobacteria bacterium UBA11371]|nr:hypothetical protein [Cyanobacteria bacterium UBA11371]
MTPEFNDLEILALENLDLQSTKDMQTWEYHDASLEEIVDLLEEVSEPFALLASSLPPQLQQSARKEIEFLTSLYQQRIAEIQQGIKSASP